VKTPQIDKNLVEFENWLLEAENNIPKIYNETWLGLLHSRDIVDEALNQENSNLTTAQLSKVIELDLKLKSIISKYYTSDIDLLVWKASLKPTTDSWWWSQEKIQQIIKENKFTLVWKFFSIILMVISLGLIVDIIPKFLSEGSDIFGAIAIIVQSLLAAIVAGGTLTTTGNETIKNIFIIFKIPFRQWEFIKFLVVFIITIILISLYIYLPSIAVYYNNRGLELFHSGQLSKAENDYHRAIKLNPDYYEAHYNLGLLYEDLQDYEKAQSEYKLALRGGLDAAYNNLGHLYIENKEYDKSIAVLITGLDISSDNEIRYDLLKNLGWARLMQERYQEAELSLESAIKITPDKASAYCLLAQTYDKQNYLDKSINSWEKCLSLATEYDTDEDVWINMGRIRLKEVENLR
jgi:tetratricopeptide (TPR) repeat protein